MSAIAHNSSNFTKFKQTFWSILGYGGPLRRSDQGPFLLFVVVVNDQPLENERKATYEAELFLHVCSWLRDYII